MNIYTFQRGETISLALDLLSGDPLTVNSISAAMKAVAPGRTSAIADAPVAAAFTIEAVDQIVDVPAGWKLTIPPAASAALSPGNYIADARLELDSGDVIITDSISIAIKSSVSA